MWIGSWIVCCVQCMHAKLKTNVSCFTIRTSRECFYWWGIAFMQSQEEIVLFSSVSNQINKFTFLWRRENEKQYYRLNTFTIAPIIVNIIYIGPVIVAMLAKTNLCIPFVKNIPCFLERQIEFWTRFLSLQIPFSFHGNLSKQVEGRVKYYRNV